MDVTGYENFVLVGAGGNAHVYRATELATGDTVAVKILRGGGDESVTRRFERERALMGELETIANVVPIFASGISDGGDPFLVMPLYAGASLQTRLEHGPLPWREAVELTRKVGSAISLAHAKRILHLDVKPANVLLDAEGEPWLADFGIAEMMGSTASMSAQMMTPAFTPPERLDGHKPSEHTDLYGLGAMLYALLAGHAPFVSLEQTSPMAVMMAVIKDPIPVGELPDEVPLTARNLVARSMAKDMSVRPKSAIEFVGLLDDVLEGRPVLGVPLAPIGDTEMAAPLGVVLSGDVATGDAAVSAGVAGAAVTDDAMLTVARPGAPASALVLTGSTAVDVPQESAGSKAPLLVVAAAAAAVVLVGLVGGVVFAMTRGGEEPDTQVAGATQSAEDTSDDGDGDDPEIEVEVGTAAGLSASSATAEENDDGAEVVENGSAVDAAAGATGDGATGNDGDGTARTTSAPDDVVVTTTTRASTATNDDDDAQTATTAAGVTTTRPTTNTTAKPTSTTTTTTTTAVSADPGLEAGFRASAGAAGSEQTVSFANITIGEATSYSWSFGDGSTSTQKAPTHTYASAGTYSVTITATNAKGSDSATHSVRVDPNSAELEAGFRASAGPSGSEQTISFENITIGDAASFTWNFGDGNTSTNSSPIHTYSSPGTYSVTITATAAGVTDSATHSVRVDPNTTTLEAGFIAAKGPAGSEQTISFQNITVGDVTSYAWNFGDGATSTQTAPSHTYAAPGTYSVTITATGPGGSDSATHSVRVDPNS